MILYQMIKLLSDTNKGITGQYGGKLRHEISPWCGMVLVLELELVLDLVSENLC